jgi:hypothetical protein
VWLMLCKCEALGSNLSPTKEEKKDIVSKRKHLNL